MLGRAWRKGNPLLHCWLEYKLVQPLWKTVWGFLKNLKIELPYYPAITLLGIHTEKNKTINAREGVEKGNPPTLLVGIQIGTAMMQNSVEAP